MNMKNIALCIGFFSIIMGWINYDPAIKTAAMPMITGGIVVVLALFGLIPEYSVCERCGKKSLGSEGRCRYCEDEGSSES